MGSSRQCPEEKLGTYTLERPRVTNAFRGVRTQRRGRGHGRGGGGRSSPAARPARAAFPQPPARSRGGQNARFPHANKSLRRRGPETQRRPPGAGRASPKQLPKFGGAERGEGGGAAGPAPRRPSPGRPGATLPARPEGRLLGESGGQRGAGASVIHSADVLDIFYYYLKRFNLLFVPACPASSPIVALRSGITRTNRRGGRATTAPARPHFAQ